MVHAGIAVAVAVGAIRARRVRPDGACERSLRSKRCCLEVRIGEIHATHVWIGVARRVRDDRVTREIRSRQIDLAQVGCLEAVTGYLCMRKVGSAPVLAHICATAVRVTPDYPKVEAR